MVLPNTFARKSDSSLGWQENTDNYFKERNDYSVKRIWYLLYRTKTLTSKWRKYENSLKDYMKIIERNRVFRELNPELWKFHYERKEQRGLELTDESLSSDTA